MPCYDGREHINPSDDAIQRDLDNVTRMLCALCAPLFAADRVDLIDSTPGLRDWWEKHNRDDEKRAAEISSLRQEVEGLRASIVRGKDLLTRRVARLSELENGR